MSFEADGRRVGARAFRGRQLPLVTAMLMLGHRERLGVEFLAEQLWPDGQVPSQWRVAVRGLVSQVRRLLAEVGVDRDVVAVDAGSYVVDLPGVVVDLEVAADRVAEAVRSLRAGDLLAARDRASSARAVVSRPVLPGIECPWLDEVRAGALQGRLGALDVLAVCRSGDGDHAGAVAVAREAVDLDPFRESAWRRLLEVHAAAGNPAAGIAVFQECRQLLVDELGVPPSAETQELYTQLLRSIPDDAQLAEPPEPAGSEAPSPVTPYRGLLPFDSDDAELFFGRDAHVQELVDRLAAHAAVAVTGPSGSGKSSLVRAGLLPALARGAVPDADTWVTVTVLPGSAPVASLGQVLEDLAGSEVVGDVAVRLMADPSSLAWMVDQAFEATGAARSARLLVVVDQAEELFTACDDPDARRVFLRALLGTADRLASRVRVVLTLRADFYADAADEPELAELLSASQYVVPPLDGDGVEAAVVGPARLAGARLEDGLVGRVVADVVGEPGTLPLLQQALLEVWQRRQGQVLTHAAYDQVGGVAGALAHRAETVFQGLGPSEQAAARRLLLRAVQPGQGTGDARRRVPLSELADPAGQPEVDAVVARFIDARLLTGGADPLTGEPQVELAHEALIAGWPRLRRWVDDSRSDLVAHRRVADGARAWDAHDRHPDYLLAGEPLAEATGVHDRAPELLNSTEAAFLQASATRQEQAARRRVRQRRLVLSTVSLAAAIAVVFAIVSVVQRNNAVAQGDLARAHALVGASQAQLSEDQDLALLLAIEAARVDGADDAAADVLGALHQAVLNHRVATTIAGITAAGQFVDDQRLILFISLQDGQPPVLWDLDAGQPVRELEAPSSGEFWDMAISRDGRFYVETYLDGTEARVWDLTTGKVTADIPIVDQQQDSPSMSPDGRTLAVINMDFVGGRLDSVSVYDLPSATERYRLDPGGLPFRTDISPDGRLLAVGDLASPTVRLFDLATGDPAGQVVGPTDASHVMGIKFGPDGDTLSMVVGAPYRLQVRDVATGRVLDDHELHGSAPFNLCQSHDGRTVGVITASEVIEVFDLEQQTRFDLPADGIDGAPSCSPDGTRMAAGTRQGSVLVWDVTATGAAETWTVPAPDPWTGVWASGSLVTVNLDGTLRRYEDGAEVATSGVVAAPVEQTWTLQASPDGRYVVTNSRRPAGVDPDAYPLLGEGRLVAYDAVTLEEVSELAPGGWPLGFSPDGRQFLLGSRQRGVFVTDVVTGEVVQEIDVDLAANPGGAFLPDGRHVVVRHDRTAEIHDLDTGAVVATACIAQFGLNVAVSPDGQLLAAADWGNETIEIFDLDRLRDVSPGTTDCDTEGPHPSDDALVTILPRQDRANFTFSADSNQLAAGSPKTGDVTVWDRASNQITVRIPHAGIAGGALITPDGQHLAVTLAAADGNSAVRLYTLDPDDLLAMARDKVTTGLTPADCARYDLGDTCPERP